MRLSRRRFLAWTGMIATGVSARSTRLLAEAGGNETGQPAAPSGASGGAGGSAPPYPRSEVITGIVFERETLQRAAEGSDIWSCTWAPEGRLYAAWGDGGGFGGTDQKGRASLGVADRFDTANPF